MSIEYYRLHTRAGGKDQVENDEAVQLQLLSCQCSRPATVVEFNLWSTVSEGAVRKGVSNVVVVRVSSPVEKAQSSFVAASSPSEKHGWRVLGGMMGPVQ